jgi:lysyl-tRNA synthetase class II
VPPSRSSKIKISLASSGANYHLAIIIKREECMADEREIRLQRLQTLREQGINPYPNNAQRTHTIADVLQHFDELAGPDGSFTLVGRIRQN